MTSDLDLSLREAAGLRTADRLYLLCDESTLRHCLPAVRQTFALADNHVLCLPAGEETKSVDGLCRVWDFLIAGGATRSSMLLVLGGGVLSDLGGMAASTFKRGIPYVNIPTTLLAMVDAAQGGKTGINYGGLKNEVGLFAPPAATIVYPPFLRSLPVRELLSGYAEMLKHALIASPLELAAVLSENALAALTDLADPAGGTNMSLLADLISRSIDIKQYIVEQDPEEQGIRKTLNFGHTIGHALEELSAASAAGDDVLSHGYAVAYGIVAELYLSVLKLGFPQQTLSQVAAFVREHYGRPACRCRDYDRLLDLMRHDKKNPSPDRISFTLLRQVGNYRLDQTCTDSEIREALDFLLNF
ncbi:MAG: 3-dehydroquinate synthase [Paludibacteraceae bacterium]|nr:3-dehydroquinate synthase [Paludibacteraceae bacterium]MBQ9704811.1 3-dehydroquinate synthase [Paludibacteraceae bacterium]